MRQFGLIGFPLTSSFSKKYFAEKFNRESITGCSYENYPLNTISEFPGLIGITPNLQGLNVTIPYKKEVMAYLHETSDAVQQMNACNCIKINNGRLKGFNTDVTGFENSFVPLIGPGHDKALVLGTGGAAAAVEYVLNKLNIPFVSVSRTGTNPVLNYMGVDKAILSRYRIIINTTPLGMYPDIDTAPPIPYEYLTPDHYLYDLVYNPAETRFLQHGLKAGATTKNGADMLVIQAEESWKIWNDPAV